MARGYRSIARIAKTYGRKGEVVATPTHDLPLLLREGLDVFVVPPLLVGPRVRRVTACVNAPGGQRIALAGIAGLDDASKLVGHELLAREGDLPDDLALHDAESLVGREVEDRRYGSLGRITAVVRGPAQDVWEVDGPFGEVMIPVVDAIVRSVDGDGSIEVDVPDGLVEGDD